MPRLSKALRILNIGFDTAATFLKAEFNISLSSLNSNITYEEYSALMSRFNYDKVLHNIIQKESASRLTHKRRTSRRMKNQKPTIILTDTEKEVFEKVVAADIINQKRIYKNKRENKIIGEHNENRQKNTVYCTCNTWCTCTTCWGLLSLHFAFVLPN